MLVTQDLALRGSARPATRLPSSNFTYTKAKYAGASGSGLRIQEAWPALTWASHALAGPHSGLGAHHGHHECLPRGTGRFGELCSPYVPLAHDSCAESLSLVPTAVTVRGKRLQCQSAHGGQVSTHSLQGNLGPLAQVLAQPLPFSLPRCFHLQNGGEVKCTSKGCYNK